MDHAVQYQQPNQQKVANIFPFILLHPGLKHFPASPQDKIEGLYRQKKGKQPDLDSIKVIGRELINDPATGDKNRLRETLADVQAKWHDLTELLVQMISFAVSLLSYSISADSAVYFYWF